MKQIIDIPDELFNIFKKHGIMAFDYFDEHDKDQIAIAIAHGTTYNPTGDLISRKELQTKHDESCAGECACCAYGVDYTKSSDSKFHCLLIDNAPPVEQNDDFYSGYVKGLGDAKSDIITLIANEYTSHGELIPNWLIIGETKVADRQKRGGAE